MRHVAPEDGTRIYSTTPQQDAKIYSSVLSFSNSVNSGNNTYNLYFNNCVQAAVKMINDADIGNEFGVPYFTTPNSWYQNLNMVRPLISSNMQSVL